jgi:hypothetical protein
MPNFDATIRHNYQDIDSLILDCSPEDLADDGSLWVNRAPPARNRGGGTHTGSNNSATLVDSAAYWMTNELVGGYVYNVTDGSIGIITANTSTVITATLSGGTDNDWDTGDTYAISTPRFGNPYQDVSANRPTVSLVGGVKQAAFTRTSSHFLKVPLANGIGARQWTFAFDYEAGADTSINQYILSADSIAIDIFRRSATLQHGFLINTPTVTSPGDLTDGVHLLTMTSSSTAELYKNNVSILSGGAAAIGIPAADPALYIGSYNATSYFCDMILRSMRIWDRGLSPLERDFAYKTLDASASYSVNNYSEMVRKIWTDDTGTASRINPSRFAPHRFSLGEISGVRPRIQIAAMVDGKTKPDSDLGGELFSITPLETPGIAPPVYKDSGWSAVFEIAVEDEGHYTYLVSRPNGGAVVVHFDAETP